MKGNPHQKAKKKKKNTTTWKATDNPNKDKGSRSINRKQGAKSKVSKIKLKGFTK